MKRKTVAAIIMQKYSRGLLIRSGYVKERAAAIAIQSSIRGFAVRQKFLYGKKHRAATLIQVNRTSDMHILDHFCLYLPFVTNFLMIKDTFGFFLKGLMVFHFCSVNKL